MRIRSIKPEFWRSDDITSLPVEDRLLFIGLWSYVDDNGVGRGDEALIVADLFATDHYRDPRETVARVSEGLARLSSKGLVTLYTVDGKPFLYVSKWEQHQRVDKPNKPRYPGPDQRDTADRGILATVSRESRETVAPGTEEQGSRGTEEQSSNDGRKRPAKKATRIPDDFAVTDQMRAWAIDKVPHIDIDAETPNFIDYWQASATMTARKLDWVAAWRTWMRNAASRTSAPRGTSRESSLDRRDRQVEEMFRTLNGRSGNQLALGGRQ